MPKLLKVKATIDLTTGQVEKQEILEELDCDNDTFDTFLTQRFEAVTGKSLEEYANQAYEELKGA